MNSSGRRHGRANWKWRRSRDTPSERSCRIEPPVRCGYGSRLVDPENVNLHYNLAGAMSSLSEIDLTLETLAGIAPRLSPGMMSWMEADPDFDPIREEPRFKAMMQTVKERFAPA